MEESSEPEVDVFSSSTAVDPVWAPQRPRVFFFHIPKTAGMAIRVFLSNQYPMSQIMPANDWVSLVNLGDSGLGDYRLYQGHYTYGIFDLLPADVRAIVFLREPVARTISHLKHLRRDPNFHPAHKLAAGRSLDDLVRDDRIMDLCCNLLTATLSNDIPGADILAGLKRDQECGRIANSDGYALMPDLAKAEAALERFAYVGFVETLQEDILLLSAALGLHPPRIMPRSNDDPLGGAGDSGLSAETLAILRERNALDIAFYETAQRRPRLSWGAAGAALLDRSPYRPISRPMNFPMSGPIPGSNWYKCEIEDGAAMRWTGPFNETMLDLPLAPAHHFEFTMSLMIANYDEFSVHIGPMELPVTRITSDGPAHRVSFWVPQELVQPNGLTSLCFRTERVLRGSASDLRMLSFLVSDLRISRVESDLRDAYEPVPSEVAEVNDDPEDPAGPPEAADFPDEQPRELVDFGPPPEPVTLRLPIDPDSKTALVGEAVGFYGDGWVRPRAAFRCRASETITSMSLKIWAPNGSEPLTVTLHGSENANVALPVERGMISILQYSINTAASNEFVVELHSNQEDQLSGTDRRRASFILRGITFS